MSYNLHKYKIVYDSNDGTTGVEEVYCKEEGVWDGQLWIKSNGYPVSFACVTDSYAEVMAKCILGIPTNDDFFYWEEIKEFDLPDAVEKVFFPKR